MSFVLSLRQKSTQFRATCYEDIRKWFMEYEEDFITQLKSILITKAEEGERHLIFQFNPTRYKFQRYFQNKYTYVHLASFLEEYLRSMADFYEFKIECYENSIGGVDCVSIKIGY